MVHIYGIKNCNTVKKALTWLTEHNIAHSFHDFKKEPATREQLESWASAVGYERLLNKNGTTWRKLDPEAQAQVTDEASAVDVLMQHNSMIKRPVVDNGQKIWVGFDEATYQHELN